MIDISLNHNDLTKRQKKRNRLSFVCQACRKSKTKCDKLKPCCTRCFKQNLSCIYDIAMQVSPKSASRTSQIRILENELDYWKKKTYKFMGLQKEKLLSSDNGYSFGDINMKPERNLINNKLTVENFWDLNINVYRNDTNLIISPIMKSEVGPLSENNIIVNDYFILSSIISIVSSSTDNESSVPAYTTNLNMSEKSQPKVVKILLENKDRLLKQCTNPQQKLRIEKFTDRILQRPKYLSTKNVGSYLTDINNDLNLPYLEDHYTIEGDYSELLKSYMKSFEEILPPYPVIMHYKAHFYENILPCLPFLNKNNFESTINSILFQDPDDPEKIIIKFGTSCLRNKLENLCLLSLIVKLSYMSLIFINEKEVDTKYISAEILKQYPISNDAITIIQNCSASENWITRPNEDVISCFLYLWSYLVFSPEEGDFFTENPTDILCNMIIMLSTTIGLHRDPSDFVEFNNSNNPELKNHRRLLWLCVISMSGIETILKGRYLSSKIFMTSFIDIDDPNVLEKYMQKVKNDMPVHDIFTLKLHENTFKQAYIVSLHQKISDLFLRFNGTFKLKELYDIKQKIDSYIEKEFMLKPLEKNLSDMNINGSDDDIINQLSLITTKNSANYLYTVLSRLIMLRVSLASLFHFEKLCVKQKKEFKEETDRQNDDINIDYEDYYYYFLNETIYYTVQLAEYINYFFKKEQSSEISPLTSYHVSKIIQLSLSSVLFSSLSICLKIYIATNDIMHSSEMVTEEMKEKLSLLEEIESLVRTSLFYTYKLVSDNLRFTYYSVFKMLAIFDIFMKKFKEGDLIHLQALEVDSLNDKITRVFGLTFNFKLEKGEKLIDVLRDRNLMTTFSNDKLRKMLEQLQNIDLVIVPNDNHSNKTIKPNVELTNGHNNFNDSLFSNNADSQVSTKGILGPKNPLNTTDPSFPNDFPTSSYGTTFSNDITNNVQNTENLKPFDTNMTNDKGMVSIDDIEFANLFGDVDLFKYDFFFGNE